MVGGVGGLWQGLVFTEKCCESVLAGDFDKFGSWFYVVGFFEKRFFGVVGWVAELCGFWWV